MKTILKKNIYFIILGIIIFIGFLFRLKGFATNPSLWHDECALGWNILNKNYAELFNKLRFLQIAPPMFLVCTKFLISLFHVKTNIFACDLTLRLIPFIFGNLSIWLFYLVCKSVFNSKWTTLIAILLFSLNPILINYSFEFKPYIVDVFCSLLVLNIFLNINFEKLNLKQILTYGMIFAILPWFSFMSAVVEFAGFLTLSYKKESPKKFFLMSLPVILSVFAYLKLFILKIYEQNSTGMLNYWQNEFIKKDLSNVTQLNFENLHYFFSDLPFFSCTMFVILMFIGAILFFKDNKLRFLFISFLIEATLVVASIMHVYPYSQRLIIFLIPILLIFGVKIFDIKNKVLASILLAFVIIPHFLFTVNFIKIKNINKGYFARSMMKQIANNIEPNDKILVNDSSNVEFFYYNLFFDLKNSTKFFKEKTQIGDCQKLEKGQYWLFMPYFGKNNDVTNIINWLENNSQIMFKAQAKQSILIKFIIN